MTVSTTLFEQIEKDYIQAYKAKDSVRVTVLRLLKTAVKNRLVDLKRPGGSLSDEEMLDLIIKEGKQRQDSIDQYTSANRADLADKEAAELEILKEYMRADVALAELERFMDKALLAGFSEVEVVHGRGTGALRRQVHDFLRSFPAVGQFALAPEDRGGDGMDRRVTAIQKEIISFKDEIVTRLRDIKLEKTLIDRIIETVEDYVRQMHNCQRDLSAYILSTGRTQTEIQAMVISAVWDKLEQYEFLAE